MVSEHLSFAHDPFAAEFVNSSSRPCAQRFLISFQKDSLFALN